ncbi:1-acyl-sn-glycerol-3-phosphate acyltransferase [bacterium]|nr:1-acyl-sn-glycerol-3-phosphate acyltransferase [bacterium]
MRGTIASLVLFPTLMLANIFQMASIVVKPFSQPVFRKINRFIANTWWGMCVLWAEKINGTQVIISGDNVPVKENAIVIINHQNMTDILVLLKYALTKQRLGDLKWFVKKSLQKVPGVGWGLNFLDALFIRRNWMDDQQLIEETFATLIQYKVPMWIISFVEGTRSRPHKIAKSREYAIKNGLKPLNYVLTPRTKGFVGTVKGLKNHATVVYDLTIGYEENPPPDLWQWMTGQVRRAHLYVRRYELSKLPQDEKGLSDWLLKVFEEKDELLAYFYTNKSFPIPL